MPVNQFLRVGALALVLALSGCQASSGTSQAPATSASASEADRAFIDGMVPHHEMANMMADDALAKADHVELKEFAQKVKTDQTAEITELRNYRQQWFGSSSTPSMSHSQVMTIVDDANFDRQWAEAMIAHHQGAIDMANQALTAATRPETKSLAQRVVDAQKKEQEQLRAWTRAWSGS
jgi:uncharacterized protein (DUF305 family)